MTNQGILNKDFMISLPEHWDWMI